MTRFCDRYRQNKIIVSFKIQLQTLEYLDLNATFKINDLNMVVISQDRFN